MRRPLETLRMTPPPSPSPSVPSAAVRPGRRRSPFYFLATVVMVLLTVYGFHHFYFQGQAFPGRPITPPIRGLVIAHGVAMASWLLLMLVQPALIQLRRPRVHMAVGRVGAVIAAAICVLGVRVGIRSAAVTPPEMRIWSLTPKGFLAVTLVAILIFAVFVALGVVWRRRPALHRTMMLLASLDLIGAGVSRIVPLNQLYVGTVWETLFGPALFALVLGVVLLAVRCVVTRAFDRAFAIGLAALIAVWPPVMHLATTAAWDRFATLLTG